jgi:integrase
VQLSSTHRLHRRRPDQHDRFYFEEPKTQSGRRTVRLAPSLVTSLRRHRIEQAQRRLTAGPDWNDHDLVCDNGRGGPVDPDAFGAAFKRLAKQTGLPTRARLHDLRHACAVLLGLEGVPIVAVAEMLGHASASFTISNYEHVVSEMQEASADALERRLGG